MKPVKADSDYDRIQPFSSYTVSILVHIPSYIVSKVDLRATEGLRRHALAQLQHGQAMYRRGCVRGMNTKSVQFKRRRGVSRLVSVVSIIVVLTMLFIALPTIPIREGWSLASVFGLIWSAFALLIIGAHLYRLLRVDEATEARLRQVKAERYRAVEERIMGAESK